MNRFLALFGFLALLLFSVTAQDEQDTLCEVNILRLLGGEEGGEPGKGGAIGDFVCARNLTEDLVPSNITLRPLTKEDVSGDTSLESRVLRFIKREISGSFNESLNNGSTSFSLKVGFADQERDDEKSALSSAVMASVSYDFDGDNIVDRLELYEVFLINKGQGNETDTQGEDEEGFFTYRGDPSNIDQVIGDNFSDMNNGSIRLSVWSPFGTDDLVLKVGAERPEGGNQTEIDINILSQNFSTISFPFEFEARNVTGGGGGPSVEECCQRIDDLRAELEDLQARVDAVASRLLNVTRTCCPEVGTVTVAGTFTGTVEGET